MMMLWLIKKFLGISHISLKIFIFMTLSALAIFWSVIPSHADFQRPVEKYLANGDAGTQNISLNSAPMNHVLLAKDKKFR